MYTNTEWEMGYGAGITGPTAPAEYATCEESCNKNITSYIITTRDIKQQKTDFPKGECSYYSSVIAILPIRSGKEEQLANARLIVSSKKLLECCKVAFGKSTADENMKAIEEIRSLIDFIETD